jgi:hypothetical protein
LKKANPDLPMLIRESHQVEALAIARYGTLICNFRMKSISEKLSIV